MVLFVLLRIYRCWFFQNCFDTTKTLQKCLIMFNDDKCTIASSDQIFNLNSGKQINVIEWLI